MSDSILCQIDDKQVPLYHIVWVADVPHFCGEEDCVAEGQYEVRLAHGETLWGSRADRDRAVRALEAWRGGAGEGGW